MSFYNEQWWDEECPECKKKYCAYDEFVNHDYNTDMEIECECGEVMKIRVESIPEFYIEYKK